MWVVYPSHGVGKIEGIETFEIDGESVEFFIISFPRNKLTLKLPVKKAIEAGLRKVTSKSEIKSIFDVLLQKTKRRLLMWSKRAQEYESKINSGDPRSIAVVIRELYKGAGEALLRERPGARGLAEGKGRHDVIRRHNSQIQHGGRGPRGEGRLKWKRTSGTKFFWWTTQSRT